MEFVLMELVDVKQDFQEKIVVLKLVQVIAMIMVFVKLEFVSVKLDIVELNVKQEYAQMIVQEMVFVQPKCHVNVNKDLLDSIVLY